MRTWISAVVLMVGGALVMAAGCGTPQVVSADDPLNGSDASTDGIAAASLRTGSTTSEYGKPGSVMHALYDTARALG